MNLLSSNLRTTAALATLLVAAGCSSSEPGNDVSAVAGTTGMSGTTTATGGGTTELGGGPTSGGNVSVTGTATGGNAATGGAGNSGGATTSGTATTGGVGNLGGSATGGNATGGASNAGGGTATGGVNNLGGAATGGKATGGTSNFGGAATGGKATGGVSASGGAATGGATSSGSYACDGTTTGYNATMIKTGDNWVVTNAGSEKYSGTDTTLALQAAYNSLTTGRTAKQSILVQGDGDIPATSQVGIPSYTIINWCGTLNVSGTSTTSDRSPLYARSKTDIEIANLKMTGSPGYGIFMRGTNNIILGNIDLRLSAGSPGIGIRVDTSGSAGTDTTFVTNLKVNHVYGSGMSSHIMETYGVDGIQIGKIEGNSVGQCGLLLNRSINAEVDTVTCTDCATGTGYAAFRVANNNGKIGDDYPAGNIHVKNVYARGGGRGIFSVSACGGLTIDSIDIANVGSTPILLQNTYNTTIAAVSGTIVAGESKVSNDTANTDPTDGRTPMVTTRNVKIQNLTLSGGASLKEEWCDWKSQGDVGNRAVNVTGGTVTMCY